MKTVLFALATVMIYTAAPAQVIDSLEIDSILTNYAWSEDYTVKICEGLHTMVVCIYTKAPEKIKDINIAFSDMETGKPVRARFVLGPMKYGRNTVTRSLLPAMVITGYTPRDLLVFICVNDVPTFRGLSLIQFWGNEHRSAFRVEE